MKTGLRNPLLLTILLAFILPAALYADPGNQYCVTPPFITAGVKPNLLLMIDNSASMYDLQYQDTSNFYCANAPTTVCTPTSATDATSATCTALAATCMASGVTTTSTTYSAKPCTTNANCTAGSSTCSAGYCTKCNTNNGVGDCVSTVSNVFTPTPCTTNATCSAITAGDTCNNKCSVTRQCYDTTYDLTITYTGYFDPAATYSFDSTNNKFTSGASTPASCSYSAGTPVYVCVNTTGAGTAETVNTDATGFVAKGNFLNWLTTSKFDVEKYYLTGGKFDPSALNLIAESRGCGGRKFIKSPATIGHCSATTTTSCTADANCPGSETCSKITFAIRGGTSSGISTTTSQATEYGQTYIDISTGTYNADKCLSAMNDWMNVTSSTPPALGGFQNDTKGCVGTVGTLGGVTAVSVWNHILHDCYQGLTGGAGGYSTNLGPLEAECKSIYSTILPSAMNDPNAGYAVCSSVLPYEYPTGTFLTGYLGACWNGTDFSGTLLSPCSATDQAQRMANYCNVNIKTNPVADPSSTAIQTASSSAPGFILEQGLLNTQPVGTFPVKIALATQPIGLIDKYKDRVRFGAMTFQNNGSGSECGGSSIPCAKACSVTTTRVCYVDSDCPVTAGVQETCGTLAKTDGGKIISYVGAGSCSVTTTTPCNVDYDCAGLTPTGQYCQPSIGDHSAGYCSATVATACKADSNCPLGEFCKIGLVRAIDDIPATSWTPFAEAFYNVIGYFARMNDYSAITPPTSRSDASFISLASPNTAASYISSKNPSQYRCQSNNVLLVTDGMSTTDRNTASEGLATLYAGQVPYTIGATTYKPGDVGYDAANVHGATSSCPPYSGSRSIADLAWVAKNRNIKSTSLATTATTTVPAAASESITTYVVYSGPQTSSQTGLCDPKTLMTNTATNGGTSLFSAADPASLNTQLDAAMSTVAAKAASGTAASILSNSEGSGANILQAVFYPKKIFDNSTSANWIGEMQNLWYYVDPYVNNSTIREDTDGDLKLNLVNDYVVRFAFDSASDKTMVQRYNDSNGDGIVTDSDKVGGLIDPDYVSSIWRAGMKLWARSDGSDPRAIYTGYNSTADSTPQIFSDAALNSTTATSLWDGLQIPAGTTAQRQGLATKLINYIRGTDQADDTAPCLNVSADSSVNCKYRNRTVTMGTCSNNSLLRCTAAADCPSATPPPSCTSSSHEWKLGDIISSTPRVQSTVRLNTYNLPAPGGYSDQTYQSFIGSKDYAGRGMVYVGSNDGMLHAFNLGTLSVKASGFEKASLTVPTGITATAAQWFGAEQWAFIPQNSLPYLKYFTDNAYSHLYYVDGRTVIMDASIGDINSGTCVKSSYWLCSKPTNGSVPMVNSSNNLDPTKNLWRTVVIAGLGLGGASRNNVAAELCTEGATGSCVKTPVSGNGYSSYFALDVTDPINPKFLWEFSNNLLGYSTTAPAIVRIGDRNTNGRWFAVFGNGPFGPIDPGTHQFKAQSGHHLRFFVVDLRTGTLVRTISFDGINGGPNINNAFAGTLLGGSIDADRRDPSKAGNYQDDAIYAGYVRLCVAGDTGCTVGAWTNGGVVRILTKEDIDPANWVGSTVIEGIGPVTTVISRTQDTKNRNLWLYFGTGRFYFRDTVGLDDNSNGRSLFGIKEPCYNTTTSPGNVIDKTCSATLLASSLASQTTSISTLTAANAGWRIDLDLATTSGVCSVNNTTSCTLDSDCPSGQACVKFGAERVVTDTVALTNGTVFFTSFKPTMDICGYGGNSFLWGVKYDTGGQAAANALIGKALIQLSTGEFREVDLSSAFTDKLNRRMLSPMTGKPPSDAPPIVSSSMNKPVKKILHIQEH